MPAAPQPSTDAAAPFLLIELALGGQPVFHFAPRPESTLLGSPIGELRDPFTATLGLLRLVPGIGRHGSLRVLPIFVAPAGRDTGNGLREPATFFIRGTVNSALPGKDCAGKLTSPGVRGAPGTGIFHDHLLLLENAFDREHCATHRNPHLPTSMRTSALSVAPTLTPALSMSVAITAAFAACPTDTAQLIPF